MTYLHACNIVHRDIKPENFLLLRKNDSTSIKMIDFGLCQILGSEEEVMCQTIGSPFYVSKEVLNGRYTMSCDLWAMGVMMFAMLAGRYPFNGADNDTLFKNIKAGVYDLSKAPWGTISEEGIQLIKSLLCDESVRITSKQAYNHPWFDKVDRHVDMTA